MSGRSGPKIDTSLAKSVHLQLSDTAAARAAGIDKPPLGESSNAGNSAKRDPRLSMTTVRHYRSAPRLLPVRVRPPTRLPPSPRTCLIEPRDDRSTPTGAYRAAALFAASLLLASCAASPLSPPSGTPAAPGLSSQNASGTDEGAPADKKAGQRELTPSEKKIIVSALAPSLKDPGSAKFRWAKIRDATEGAVNYCGTVNAKSPYPAYSGQQAYILEATISGGKVSAAVVGLIAGGKDIEIVRSMCKKYDLDPNDAT
jgi:hypothetical protein